MLTYVERRELVARINEKLTAANLIDKVSVTAQKFSDEVLLLERPVDEPFSLMEIVEFIENGNPLMVRSLVDEAGGIACWDC